MVINYILIIIILLVLSYYYNTILKKDDDIKTSHYYYEMIDKYLLNSNSLGINDKPYLWIYLCNNDARISEVNSRSWLNFNSRNTKKLNQPYQYLCIKSIIEHCKNDFNIYLIDDYSFDKIIPNWNIDVTSSPNPLRYRLRNLALSNILNIYGGFIVPSSFICFKSLKTLYQNNLIDKDFFINNLSDKKLYTNCNNSILDIKFMGSKPNNSTIKEFIKEQQYLISKSFSSEFEFVNKINIILSHLHDNNLINIIESKYLGFNDENNDSINIEKLFTNDILTLDKNCYGLYIPWNDILFRKNYTWFANLSIEEVLKCDNNISYYILFSNNM